MKPKLIIRAATGADYSAWKKMWKQYCDFYRTKVPERITRATWKRILDPDAPIYALIAVDATGKPVAFANYVLHSFTWSDRPACYLDDLFVAPSARKKGVARAMLRRLVALSKKNDWARLYWMTEENNYRARGLYDQFVPRDGYVRYRIQF